MAETATEKIERVKQFLDHQGIFYTEFANGHLKVDTTNLWATTEKWNGADGKSGQGLNSYIKYLKESNII